MPTPPEQALLLVGTLFSRPDIYPKALRCLEECFGEAIMESPMIEWDFSEHYKEELGGPIFRRFIFFRKLIEQDHLSACKLKTCEIENSLSDDGKRTINLDPGYLTVAKLVLASTKDYSHRLYLTDGIFAEVTLSYSKDKGKYTPFSYTYRDYYDERYLRLFSIARSLLIFLSRG
ncbi:MAG: DUF4416 family protein [Nitrospirae bacterium]|nr:DUF4416 family protein [Nitrospirota bacterium]